VLLLALLVFVAATALRVTHLAALKTNLDGTSLFSLARGDAAYHWHEAQELLDRNAVSADRIPWKGPGYSYFLAGMMKLVGRSPGSLRWPLALLGGLNCALLVILARRFLPPVWSFVAGLLAACNGVLIFFDGELLFPTLLITLNLAALLMLSTPGAKWIAHAGAGLCMGLAAIVHPVYLLPASLLGLWSGRRCLRHGLAFLLAVAAGVAPVTFTNFVVRGQPTLISWNGGINFYVGNHPAFDQYSGNRTQAWARILQSTVDAGIEEESRRDRFYYRAAARQAMEEPLRALAILAQKTWILCSPVEYASNIRLYELREYSPVLAATLGRWGPLWLPFGIWAPPALLGIWFSLRRRSLQAQLLALWSLGLMVSIVLSFNTARYRAPLVFFGCIWVACTLAEAWKAWKERDRRRLIVGGALCVALAALLSLTAVPQRGFPLPLEWDEAAALVAQGSAERAHPWIEQALARAPEDPQLHHAVAGFHARLGNRDAERMQLRQLLALEGIEPDMISIGHHLLARSLAGEGRFDEARREIQAAIAVGVDDTVWRGRPYYPLGLGPVTACWLKLEAARIELDAGEVQAAADLVVHVRNDCVDTGRLGKKLKALEAGIILSEPRLD